MKYLIMTEGTCELSLLDVLAEKNLLKYPLNSLVYEKCHHARQVKGEIAEMVNQLPINEKVTVIRVADKFTDSFSTTKLDGRFENMIQIRISPEFEILFIINENLFAEYEKVKSKMKPSEFYKKINKNYKKSKTYVYQYFMKMENGDIINLFKKYNIKRARVHKKDEMTLLDLISFKE